MARRLGRHESTNSWEKYPLNGHLGKVTRLFADTRRRNIVAGHINAQAVPHRAIALLSLALHAEQSWMPGDDEVDDPDV